MPFWDDAKLTDLPELSDRLFLVDVFEQPERFRLNTIGAALNGAALTGAFLDHADLDQSGGDHATADPARSEPESGSTPLVGVLM